MAKIICIKTGEVLGHLPQTEPLMPRAVKKYAVTEGDWPAMYIIAHDYTEALAIMKKGQRDYESGNKEVVLSSPTSDKAG